MDKKIYRIITEYKQQLEGLEIRVEKIILYGSHAVNKNNGGSDIDIAVISNSFRNMGIWERLALLGRARVGINEPMEILGFTEKEFKEESAGSFVGDEIKAKGVSVI